MAALWECGRVANCQIETVNGGMEEQIRLNVVSREAKGGCLAVKHLRLHLTLLAGKLGVCVFWSIPPIGAARFIECAK